MIRKATLEEKMKYLKTDPVYPLYGFTKIDGVECPIEFLGSFDSDNKYEILLPDGYEFYDACTTKLARNLTDLKDIIRSEGIRRLI